MDAVRVILYILLAPVIGGLLDGLDRRISARMQGRQGPPILQPFYDLSKLFSKEMIAVNSVQMLLNLSYLVFFVIAGSMLFAGADILMCLFLVSTADMFLVMAASCDSSPYSSIGANREMVQLMACEPMLLLLAVGFYLATGSFQVREIVSGDISAIAAMPGFLVGFLFITGVKLRKSPSDLSTSHHAHQEVVNGLTTEMSGTTFAIMTITEYYEMVMLLGIVSLFFANSTWWSWIIAVIFCLAAFFIEVFIDNVSARVKWDKLLAGCWAITLVAGGLNGLILMIIQ